MMLPHQPAGPAVWRIRQQKEPAQLSTQRLHESPRFPHPMSLAAINEEDDFAPRTLDRAHPEQVEDSGVDAAPPMLMNRVWPRNDRQNQAHAVAGAGGFDDRRFASFAPSAPRLAIATSALSNRKVTLASSITGRSGDISTITQATRQIPLAAFRLRQARRIWL